VTVDPRAGELPEAEDLVDLDALLAAYHEHPPAAPVAFGTSGHRGTSLDGSFTEAHVVAISAAVCRFRAEQGTTGAVPRARHPRAVRAAFRTIVEVLAGTTWTSWSTPPGASRRRRDLPRDPQAQPRRKPDDAAAADGIVVTPSHNPPATAASSTTRRTEGPPTPT
jgi:phosphoglucomutase